MTVQNCKHYNTCSAPLCPLDKEGLQEGVWYPDEEICCSRNHNQVDWVKMQRKIAKRCDSNFYFTFEMLNRNCIVRKAMQGINPDKAEEPQLKKWFKAHPEKPKLTLIEKKAKAKRMQKVREHIRAVA